MELSDRVLLVAVYWRTNLTMRQLGPLFGVSHSAVHRVIGPITPHKKPPGGELTAKQKAYNYSVNRLRAAVERAISHLKNWKSSRPATTES